MGLKSIAKKMLHDMFTYRDRRQFDKRKVIVQKKHRRWY